MAGVRFEDIIGKVLLEDDSFLLLEDPPKNEGAVRLAFLPFDDKALFWTTLPNPTTLTILWQAYVENYIGQDLNVHFGTCFVIAPTAFTGGPDYVVAFHNQINNPPRWAVGNDGLDTLAVHTVELGRWYSQCFQRWESSPGVWTNRFWYDVAANQFVDQLGPAFPAYTDHRLMFGSVPYTQQEGLNGRMRAISVSESLWTLAEIQKYFIGPVPKINRSFWAYVPGRSHTDTLDYSGNNRHPSVQNVITTAQGPVLPNTALPSEARAVGSTVFRVPVSPGSRAKVSLSRELWPSGQAVTLTNEYTTDGQNFNFLSEVSSNGGPFLGRNGVRRLYTDIETEVPPGTVEIQGTLTAHQTLTTGVDVEVF